ncbi:Phosphatidylinositolglycan class N-domain-containing protein [Catenaria anguillulae PL171]|uniref:GPI ethanolamine phosphate transferase 1 n=1 Tax=Catenaria anguillulae PL171 TaxID=765915 RepID=A0A1Y2HTF2_9FUNG|nr:Phosphatidylinositolglycan class N-domain-containing protein [Catenaria anguillulae PL171]
MGRPIPRTRSELAAILAASDRAKQDDPPPPQKTPSLARNARSIAYLILLGVLCHSIFAISIFDIYFTSPVVHGMPASVPHSPTTTPPARRLILFVADGLRADTLFSHPARAPYLHRIAREKGAWGVSHTRVPTESRPGHVALIAGMYEDVSAVTKGWKLNPVDFDSMVNASRATFMYGSPDILPMFEHGAVDTKARVRSEMYSAEEEDFAGKTDASQLDTWTFERFLKTLDDDSAKANLDGPQTFIFLHLLGLDTNGHAHGPHSDTYRNNLQLVDAGIAKVVKAVETRFPGGDTAYVFTSDHGMHARGNHGDGDPQNTLTPLVAWGAGIRKPIRQPGNGDMIHANGTRAPPPPLGAYPGVDAERWATLIPTLRRDVHQADVSPLMASLIGSRVPMNGVGVLPADLLEDRQWAKVAKRANALQILFMYLTKAKIRRDREPWYTSFEELSVFEHVPRPHLAEVVAYYYADDKLDELVDLSLRGLDYLQKYDWLFLRSIVSLGYVGWMCYSLSHVIFPTSTVTAAVIPATPYIPSILITVALGVFLLIKHAPTTYYLYSLLSVYLWDSTARRFLTLAPHAGYSYPSFKTIVLALAYIAGLEVLVASYEHRWLLFPVASLLAVWPFMPWSRPSKARLPVAGWRLVWSVSVTSAGAWTLLPPVGAETDVTQLALGVALTLVLSVAAFARSNATAASKRVYWTCISLSAIAACNVAWIVTALSNRQGLPSIAQIISWTILVASPLALALDRRPTPNPIDRVTLIALASAPVYILLSTAYELGFVACYATACVAWCAIEHTASTALPTDISTSSAVVTSSDLRTAFTFLTLIHLGFFGTGNIASLASFTLASVYRLITVFSPFTMGALLIFKVILPFAVASAAFRVVAASSPLAKRAKKVGNDPFAVFLLVVSTCDVLTLHFFWNVRDEGSWLEIGTSISQFGIASGFLVFLFLLYLVCGTVVGKVVVPMAKPKLA